MRYRATCLSPLLVGNGDRLAPIDYMVWRHQVNVLDQRKIFRLLSKGPRLESYLSQIKNTVKLDFASWGGFAQNYADRRIPFEDDSLTEIWNQTSSENLFIPTFVSSVEGPYLPGAAVKGALRTALLARRWAEGLPARVAEQYAGASYRPPGAAAEEEDLGKAGRTPLRLFSTGDSAPVGRDHFQVYLTRVAALQKTSNGQMALGWKMSPRGSAPGNRPADSTPTFAEMAQAGTVFEGCWQEKGHLFEAKVRQALGWREELSRESLFAAANEYAARLLDLEDQYAVHAGLSDLRASIAGLRQRLEQSTEGRACLLNLGWGGGLLGKAAWIGSDENAIRKLMERVPVYSRALRPGLPFPKTRRIVFVKNQPAALPGWVLLEVAPEKQLAVSPADQDLNP